MIRFSKIDDELSIYKKRTVILFGAGNSGLRIKKELEGGGIKINSVCDNNINKWGEDMDGLEIISPFRLCEIYNDEVLVQISSVFSKEIEKQLEELDIHSFISYEEYCARMGALCIYKNLPQNLEAYKAIYYDTGYPVLQIKEKCLEYAARMRYFDLESYNIICLPPKTGNHTLEASLHRYHVEYVRISPCYDRIFCELKQFIKGKKIKIVTAVRDPIAQNISFFFQSNTRFCDIPEYWKDGGDVQTLWDAWVSHILGNTFQLCGSTEEKGNHIVFEYMDYVDKLLHNMIAIQNFFEENFEKYNGIDVYKYPFDKLRGYSIIHDGNTEIFIYQLEKLNDIKDDLGKFLGIEDFQLINDNVGVEKWYASAYRQALKELKLSREYFEYCYSSRLARHFYNKENINEFKRRWIENIDD